jgi:hypothetical protein
MSEVDVPMTAVMCISGTDSSGEVQYDVVVPVVEDGFVEFIHDQLVQPVMPVLVVPSEQHGLLAIPLTGVKLDPSVLSGYRMIQDLHAAIPSEEFSNIFFTALVFEERCVYRRDMRVHPMCRGMWRFDGVPIMIAGINCRLRIQDAPAWCDGPMEVREANHVLFYSEMDFLWRVHLDPALPFKLMDRVRENGQDGGIQAICRFDCRWD